MVKSIYKRWIFQFMIIINFFLFGIHFLLHAFFILFCRCGSFLFPKKQVIFNYHFFYYLYWLLFRKYHSLKGWEENDFFFLLFERWTWTLEIMNFLDIKLRRDNNISTEKINQVRLTCTYLLIIFVSAARRNQKE